MSTEKYAVRMAKDIAPNFPEECALCGKKSPNSKLEVVSGDALSNLFSNSHMRQNAIRCTVPVCDGCGQRWTMKRFGQWAILGGTFLALMMLCRAILPFLPADWLPDSPKGINAVALVVVVLIMLPIYSLVTNWLAVPIMLYSYPEFAEYQFRDVAYGERFENLNNLIGDIDDQFARLEESQEDS